jgi:DnaA family protein
MKQLLLDWGATPPQSLDNFVVGKNTELLALLNDLATQHSTSIRPSMITIWGHAGSGKSHLLQALHATTKGLLLTPKHAVSEFAWSADQAMYLLDDCDLLSEAHQIAAFALYNQVREAGGSWVASANQAPAQLKLREDLRTRLGWGLIYELHGLSDEEKLDALAKSAESRGLSLSPGVLPYLLTHFRRDMPSLSAMLDALDRYSLETQRPITLPLLRELLQSGEATTSL